MEKIILFLIFDGQAEAAMQFYTSIFPNSEIREIIRYTSEEPGIEGTVREGLFTLNGTEYRCSDMTLQDNATFTPALSLLVICDSEAEMYRIIIKLSQGGNVLRSSDTSGLGENFVLIKDKFGLSWQLRLPFKTEEGNLCFAKSKDVRPDYREF